MPYVLATFLISLVAVLLYAFALFDRVLRSEYESHRPAWEADGRPIGFFWRARESGYFFSYLAFLRVSFAWLFMTPKWVADSPQAGAALRKLRLAVLTWNVGALIWFAMFLFSLRK